MRRFFYLFFFGFLGLIFNSQAQTLPVGTPVLDDYYRRMQLLGLVDSNLSFTARPLFNADPTKAHFSFVNDSLIEIDKWSGSKPLVFANGRGVFKVLPFIWQQQYNSNHPYGWNDGAMIPARGYQTMVSGGFYFKLGPLSIQFRPEYVHAENKAFIGFDGAPRPDGDFIKIYYYYNYIDRPERFGTSAYKRAFWGQSSVRLTFNPISVGLSNENIWWGPGMHNSLIMSNNAPGFKHITLNSTRPIKTLVGHVDFQAVAGRLEGTNYPPLATTSLANGYLLYQPKRNEWRYFTGFNFNYQPKWTPGLTLGLTRTFNAYGADVKKLADYIPFFFPYQKQSTDNAQGDPMDRDQYTSVYARWLFKKAKAEVYFEYGLNDNSHNYRDFIGSPDHSRAYLVGMRKMIPLIGKTDQFIMVGVEVTQLSQTVDRLVRNSGTWYEHSMIRQGHTNEGQIMGAGSGSGGNLQHIDVSWVSGLKKLGVSFDRYEPNSDLSQVIPTQTLFYSGNDRLSGKWVDLVFGINGEWNYKNMLFDIKLRHIHSLNYQWMMKNYTAGQFYVPNNTATNFSGRLGITYRF